MKTTRPQREAMVRLYRRVMDSDNPPVGLTYRAWRRANVQPTFLMDDAVVVSLPWCFVAVERDGYAHS